MVRVLATPTVDISSGTDAVAVAALLLLLLLLTAVATTGGKDGATGVVIALELAGVTAGTV